MEMMTKTRFVNAVERILTAEKVTKKDLADISREGMLYVWESHDIENVNRLVKGLAGIRRKEAIAFFTHFLPHDVEKDKSGEWVRFGKMHKGQKRIADKLKALQDFLADESNTIWTWSDSNLELKKAIDTAKSLDTALTRAFQGVPEKDGRPETPPMDPREIMKHIITSGAVTLETMLEGAELLAQAHADAAKVMEGDTRMMEAPEQQAA